MFCPARLALFAVALAAAVPGAHAQAQTHTFGLHLVSYHEPDKTYNNTNPGLYYRHPDGWTAGFYRNSVRRDSIYVGYTWKYGIFDITTAGVSGYFHKVQPLLVPSVSLGTWYGVTPRIAYIPRVEKKIGSHVLHLMVEF
jgi:hypothetical protein